MAKEVKEVPSGHQTLAADGIIDNAVAGLVAPLTSAEHVEVSVVRATAVEYGVIGLISGIFMESRGISIPGVSKFLRPRNSRI